MDHVTCRICFEPITDRNWQELSDGTIVHVLCPNEKEDAR